MNALDLFRKEWMTLGMESMASEPSDSSDDLPPVPRLDPTGDWLPKLHPKIEAEMAPHRLADVDRTAYTQNRDTVLRQAERVEAILPDLFLAISGSFELQDRIPSCTGCYFDLPDHLLASPFREGDQILRFLNDQQAVLCWYLYLPKGEESFVIISSGDVGESLLDKIDFAEDPGAVSAASDNTAVVARSFDEFIYRYWIENLTWFNLEYGLPMSEAELDYMRHIVPEFQDPNAPPS